METIKHEIEAYLKRKKMRPVELARKAGISPAILSLLLSGTRKGMTTPTWEKLRAVMK